MTQHNEEFKDKAEGAAFIAGGTAAGAVVELAAYSLKKLCDR